MKTTAEKVYIHYKPFVKLITGSETLYCPVADFFYYAVALIYDEECLTIQTPSCCYRLYGWTLQDYESFLKDAHL